MVAAVAEDQVIEPLASAFVTTTMELAVMTSA